MKPRRLLGLGILIPNVDTFTHFFSFPSSVHSAHSRGNHSRLRGDHLQVIRQITVRPLASW